MGTRSTRAPRRPVHAHAHAVCRRPFPSRRTDAGTHERTDGHTDAGAKDKQRGSREGGHGHRHTVERSVDGCEGVLQCLLADRSPSSACAAWVRSARVAGNSTHKRERERERERERAYTHTPPPAAAPGGVQQPPPPRPGRARRRTRRSSHVCTPRTGDFADATVTCRSADTAPHSIYACRRC